MIVERKVFFIECDVCAKVEMFYARKANDRILWPQGWISKTSNDFEGVEREYHYCEFCKELIVRAGS